MISDVENYRLIGDDDHVQDVVAERILAVGISSVVDEVIIDIFVAETRRKRQRILTIIRVTYASRHRYFLYLESFRS